MLTLCSPENASEKLHGAISEEQVKTLLDQIGEGLRLDDATNREKLEIALKYGPILIELKKAVPHGQFKCVLSERFPKISYSKCNRWMLIARNQSKVAQTLRDHPDVPWGPKKMVDFLNKTIVQRPRKEQEELSEEDHWTKTSRPMNWAKKSENQLISDDSDEVKPSEKWEALVNKAESELIPSGVPRSSVVNDSTVNVTVFSKEDHASFKRRLEEWEPQDVPSVGKTGMKTLKVSIARSELPTLVIQLGKMLKHSLPTQLKVSVEV